MRRLMFTAIASVAVVAFVPASALAQHHGRHHKRHHHHAHIRRFGDVTSPGSPTTTPSPSQSAGTVASFSNGVLTITLTDGSTVSGAVTNDTEIECMAPDTSGSSGSSGTMQRADDSPGDNGGGDQGSGDDDNGGASSSSSCSTADLTQGTPVAGAELKITSSGNVWDKIELMSSSTSSSGPSGGDGGGSD